MNPYSPNSTIIITIYPCIYLYIQQLGDQPHRFHLWWPCRLLWLAIFHNRFFYSLSLSLSPRMYAYLCLDMALYMHCVYTFIMICLLEPFFLQFLVQAKVPCNMLSSYLPNIYPSLETEKKWNYGNEKGRIGFSPLWSFREFCLTFESYS